MKRLKNKWFLVIALTVIITVTTGAALVMGSGGGATYTVIARNDLGMHCACPSFAGFLLLPPFNTIRVQVLQKGSKPLIVSSGITVSYSIAEETDASLQADPYFSQWITYAPKLFPGFQPVVGGKVMGLAGYGIEGTATYDSQSMSWIAKGIPVYPIHTGNSSLDIMTDPLFTTQTSTSMRDPYLTANIVVKNSSGTTIGTTSTVVPVAFGGCCGCHLKLAAANGYPSTPAGSFAYLGKLHGQNGSKIDFNYLDPDGDGVAGPVRCSVCHWDPAMGESAAPGYLNSNGTLQTQWANLKILAGASFTISDLKVSQYSFSDVLHRFHAQDPIVLSSSYDPNIAVNCYDCHPGNNVNCYRGVHKGKSSLWCVDCHGNLNQRIAAGQLTQPWQESTLPSCFNASPGATPSAACHTHDTTKTNVWNPGLFGVFINDRGHEGSMLCESCHGSAHAEAPSTMALDNVENSTLQGAVPGATYPAGVDSTYPLGVCNTCHTSKGTTWQRPPHLYN